MKRSMIVCLLLLLPVCNFLQAYSKYNDIPPRYQWNGNSGYCGEVALVTAGLYYGQYVSQYDARAIACDGASQKKCQLLLGVNDIYAAERMRLKVNAWECSEDQTAEAFLAWVKQQVVQGYPVAIGVFSNQYLFYGDRDSDAGDEEYDHIVSVTGVSSVHALTNPNYYGNDTLTFSDNGLWSPSNHTQYFFSSGFDEFQVNRKQANAKDGSIYSLNKKGNNYGLAFIGVEDLQGDTLPVRIETNVNYEWPEIADNSKKRPASMPIELTINIYNLEPNVLYKLYRYSDFDSVPVSRFNAHAKKALEQWDIQIASGSNYILTHTINSDETAVYRCVRATAP